MTIAITQDHNSARLDATKTYLDGVTGNATIALYAGTRPATPLTAPASAPLAYITLAQPCGTIADGVLTLVQNDPVNGDLIAVTGSATWARVFTSGGTPAADGTVTDATGNGDFKIAGTSGTTLYAGGIVLLGSAALG